MTDEAFPTNLNVLVGLGILRRIASVQDALSFLEGLPLMTRDEAWEVTREACLDALAGRVNPREAGDMVAAFARRHGMLIDEPVASPVPSQLLDQSKSGAVTSR